MKVKNIRLIVFVITVMNISLGRSRLFMRPNFWIMENAKDPKDAVLNLELNPAPEVAALKRDAPQDAVGFNLVPSQDATDLVPHQDAVDLNLVPSKDAVGFKLTPSQEATELVPHQDAVGFNLVPTKDALGFIVATSHDATDLIPIQDAVDLNLIPTKDIDGYELTPLQDTVDSKDSVGLKYTPAPVAQEPRLMVFPKGKY